jgi:hypothetical protein
MDRGVQGGIGVIRVALELSEGRGLALSGYAVKSIEGLQLPYPTMSPEAPHAKRVEPWREAWCETASCTRTEILSTDSRLTFP